MRQLGIFVALVAFAAVAMLLVGQGTAPTQAGGDPVISLDADDTACSGAHEDKCTLNVGDSFQVTIDITNNQGINNGYADWEAEVTFDDSILINDSTKAVSSSVCVGTSSVSGTTTPITIDCTGVTAKAHTGTELAVLNFTCDNDGAADIDVSVNIDQNGNGSNDFTNLTDSIEINCGETATIALDEKVVGKPVFVGDTMTVGVKISDLKLKNADDDAKDGGYNGWQARVNFDDTKLALQSLAFTGDLAIDFRNPATNAAANTAGSISFGSSVGTGQNESVFEGNVAELTFEVLTAELAGGTDDVVLSDAKADTHLLTEKNSQIDANSGLTVDTTPFEQRTAGAEFSFGFKGACKVLDGNVCTLASGDSVTVSVNLDRVEVSYTRVQTVVRYDPGNNDFLTAAVTFPNDPPCDNLLFESVGTIDLTARCDQDSKSMTVQDNVFDISLTCKNVVSTAVEESIISFRQNKAETLTTIKNGTTSHPVELGKDVTIRCAGTGSDDDGDGCTPTQEAAISGSKTLPNGPLLPNVYDFPNAVRDDGLETISVADITAVVQDFVAQNLVSVTGDALDDIVRVVALFGNNCDGDPDPTVGP